MRRSALADALAGEQAAALTAAGDRSEPGRGRGCAPSSPSCCRAGTSTPPGTVHRDGVMRLATARDELVPLRDDRVRENPAYLTVVLLGRVITRLGTIDDVHAGIIENLFASDLAFLQDLYRRVNQEGHTRAGGDLPGLRPRVRGRPRRWAPGGIVTYAADRLYEEVAYVAYHFHWSRDEILDLEHAERPAIRRPRSASSTPGPQGAERAMWWPGEGATRGAATGQRRRPRPGPGARAPRRPGPVRVAAASPTPADHGGPRRPWPASARSAPRCAPTRTPGSSNRSGTSWTRRRRAGGSTGSPRPAAPVQRAIRRAAARPAPAPAFVAHRGPRTGRRARPSRSRHRCRRRPSRHRRRRCRRCRRTPRPPSGSRSSRPTHARPWRTERAPSLGTRHPRPATRRPPARRRCGPCSRQPCPVPWAAPHRAELPVVPIRPVPRRRARAPRSATRHRRAASRTAASRPPRHVRPEPLELHCPRHHRSATAPAAPRATPAAPPPTRRRRRRPPRPARPRRRPRRGAVGPGPGAAGPRPRVSPLQAAQADRRPDPGPARSRRRCPASGPAHRPGDRQAATASDDPAAAVDAGGASGDPRLHRACSGRLRTARAGPGAAGRPARPLAPRPRAPGQPRAARHLASVRHPAAATTCRGAIARPRRPAAPSVPVAPCGRPGRSSPGACPCRCRAPRADRLHRRSRLDASRPAAAGPCRVPAAASPVGLPAASRDCREGARPGSRAVATAVDRGRGPASSGRSAAGSAAALRARSASGAGDPGDAAAATAPPRGATGPGCGHPVAAPGAGASATPSPVPCTASSRRTPLAELDRPAATGRPRPQARPPAAATGGHPARPVGPQQRGPARSRSQQHRPAAPAVPTQPARPPSHIAEADVVQQWPARPAPQRAPDEAERTRRAAPAPEAGCRPPPSAVPAAAAAPAHRPAAGRPAPRRSRRRPEPGRAGPAPLRTAVAPGSGRAVAGP